MNRSWFCRCLANGADTDPVRGDHTLNPGTDPPSSLTPAAVLVPVVDHPSGLTLLLTRRTDHLAHHAGQISFPGGHIEAGDSGPDETALRETEEEVGLRREQMVIVGRLSDYVTRTGFNVTPVVAVVTPPLKINPDPDEVAEVFEVPLEFILEPANHQRHSGEFDGHQREFFALPYREYYIWGATAAMLINLYRRLLSS